MIEVSYSEARARLAELLDRVTDNREVVRIRRQGNRPGAVLIDFYSLNTTDSSPEGMRAWTARMEEAFSISSSSF